MSIAPKVLLSEGNPRVLGKTCNRLVRSMGSMLGVRSVSVSDQNIYGKTFKRRQNDWRLMRVSDLPLLGSIASNHAGL